MGKKTEYQAFDVNKELVQHVFDEHGLGRVEHVVRIEEGMINDVYSINGAYVLKVNSAHPKLPKLANEAAVYEALAKSSVPVPKVFGHTEKRDLVGYPYIILEQLPGKTLKGRWETLTDTQKATCSFEAGNLLANIHSLPPTEVELVNQAPESNLKERLSVRMDTIGRELRSSRVLDEKTIDRIETHYRTSESFDIKITSSLLHGNYVFANLIVSEEKIRGVIDWEWASFGHGEEELAVTLYRGPLGVTGAMDGVCLNRFKEGYLSARSLSDTFEERYLSYVLLYFLKVLPSVPQWSHRPDKQKEYMETTRSLLAQIGL